ncbi:DMT family transporter [Acinetobacter sp. MD2(2019)]|uniref:DMT family transporter n=1 Tax=Acinetobacter sp. MD2(2019) TaxID=2605273 RepID=UPI002D1F08F2|nr:DMT family transporter [Acinetobacter sp. MD2(2019)]MEB3754157.1 EamA family transporter [Acinetobacter sp. MD2(2019)]
MQSIAPTQENSVTKALLCLMTSAFLFSIMGVCIRFASHTVDNATIVFFRNAVGLFIFIPMLLKQGLSFVKTNKLWMHTWRSLVGLTAMYGFFYAIANLKLSNAMVFSYSSPIFIPLIAWLFLKERITKSMIFAAAIGLVGVLFVAKPDQGMFNALSFIGLGACFLSAMAFVTVRALTNTEPPERIVFYFCIFGTIISAIPMYWHWRVFTEGELCLLIAAGILANISQLFMSYAYSLAPAGQIGPMNYIAIVFAGIWGFIFWHELPDTFSIIGILIIIFAIVLCNPAIQKRFFS